MYNKIKQEELETKYEKLKIKIFDITKLLLTLFRDVEDLCDVATVLKMLYTSKQKLG